jgi:parallel beta-helix repeat protein
MKKIVISMLFIVATVATGAQIISVVSPAGVTANVSTLQKAIDTAAVGSMIYLPGNTGGFSAGMKIDKKLHIIGVGYRDDNNLVTGKTLINGNITFIPGSDGSTLMGVYLEGNIIIGETGLGTTGYVVNNLLIQRCNINKISQVTPNSSTYGGTGIKIHQNIIRSYEIFLRVQNPIISNNIFTYSTAGSSIYYTSGAIIENNIFYSYRPINSTSNTYFRNNICLGGWDTYLSRPTVFINNIICSETTFVDNYYNVRADQIFKKWEGYSGFRYSDDYRLLDSSVGKNGGHDGKDVGIYGGDGWKEGGLPFNPHVVSADIAPSTAADGTLNMKIKVTVDPQ